MIILNVWTSFYSIYWRDFDPTHRTDSQYIRNRLLKVWSHAPLWSLQERHCDSLWADFCCNTSSVHVAIFSFLLELPNNWYVLRYDSCTCIALLAETGHFYPICYISLVRSLMLFGHCHFGSSLANGRILSGESRYSSNNVCALHCYVGRGVVISSIQKITHLTIPGIQYLVTYSSCACMYYEVSKLSIRHLSAFFQ